MRDRPCKRCGNVFVQTYTEALCAQCKAALRPGSDELTQRQREIYEFIRDVTLSTGRSPTIREVAAEFGITSPNGVVCHLRSLATKGYIRPANRKHGIEIVKRPFSYVPPEKAEEFSERLLAVLQDAAKMPTTPPGLVEVGATLNELADLADMCDLVDTTNGEPHERNASV